MTTTGEHLPTTHPNSDEIVARLRELNRNKVAERVAYLLSLDGDDPSEQPIDITSLRDFAQMIEDNWKLPDPRISRQSERAHQHRVVSRAARNRRDDIRDEWHGPVLCGV